MKNIKILLMAFVSLVVTDSFSGQNVDATQQLWDGVLGNNFQMVQEALIAGAQVEARDLRGDTPLYIADQEDIIRLLIAHGADINARGFCNTTSLHSACLRGNRDKVNLLIANGADVNARDHDNITPLHLSANRDIANLLITNGADINARNKWGYRPLHTASSSDREGIEDVINILIENGADVNEKTSDGKTPLFGAISRRCEDVVRALIENKADVDVVEKGENIYLKKVKDMVKLHEKRRLRSRQKYLQKMKPIDIDREERDREKRDREERIIELVKGAIEANRIRRVEDAALIEMGLE